MEIILATTVSRIKNEILSLKCFGGFSLPLNFLIAPCVSATLWMGLLNQINLAVCLRLLYFIEGAVGV